MARACRAAKVIVLSYDDGPGPQTTPQLLKLLADRGICATFFPLGSNAKTRPELAARMIAQGHEVGSHTFDHTNAWKTGPRSAAQDRDRGIAHVSGIGGEGRLFRPPYGKLTLVGLVAAWRRGLRLAWWTIDSRDSWQRRSAGEVLANIDAAGGGVVLMHDADTYERSGSGHPDYVVDLTRCIIDHAQANGYHLIRLGDLLEPGGKERD